VRCVGFGLRSSGVGSSISPPSLVARFTSFTALHTCFGFRMSESSLYGVREIHFNTGERDTPQLLLRFRASGCWAQDHPPLARGALH